MGKAIYGLAQPFQDCYVDYVRLFNEYKIDRTTKESVVLDSLVGATLNHDYSKEIGRSTRNLSFVINDKGIYFKLIPDTELGMATFKDVQQGRLKQCSISYMVGKKHRDYEAEERLQEVSKLMGWKESYKVYSYSKILVHEICLTNNPANDATFCTTNPNDKRLIGVCWE